MSNGLAILTHMKNSNITISFAFNKRTLIASATTMNKKGNWGSPWQRPHDALNRCEGDRFTKIAKEVDEMHFFIHALHLLPKLILPNMLQISIQHGHRPLQINFENDALNCCLESISSLALSTPSMICLFLTKAPWKGLIISRKLSSIPHEVN